MVWSCYYVILRTHYGKNKKVISAINATFTPLTPLTQQLTTSHHHHHLANLTKVSKLPYMDSCLKVYRYITNTYFIVSPLTR